MVEYRPVISTVRETKEGDKRDRPDVRTHRPAYAGRSPVRNRLVRLIAAHNLIAAAGGEGGQEGGGGIVEKADRAVGEEKVSAAGVQAPKMKAVARIVQPPWDRVFPCSQGSLGTKSPSYFASESP